MLQAFPPRKVDLGGVLLRAVFVERDLGVDLAGSGIVARSLQAGAAAFSTGALVGIGRHGRTVDFDLQSVQVRL